MPDGQLVVCLRTSPQGVPTGNTWSTDGWLPGDAKPPGGVELTEGRGGVAEERRLRRREADAMAGMVQSELAPVPSHVPYEFLD